MQFNQRAIVLVSALLLSACGGGGGGGGSTAAGASPATAVTITATNAKPVAADALQSATDTSATDSGGMMPVGVQVESGASAVSILQAARVARSLAALAPASTQMASGVSISDSIPCDSGGTLTVSGNVAGSTGLTAGDTITMTANACKQNMGGSIATTNGSMTITVNSGSLTTTGPFHVVMTMSFSNFSMELDGVVTSMNGDTRFDWNSSSDVVETITASGSSMAHTIRSGTTTRTATWKSYTQTISVDAYGERISLNATIETSNPQLGSGLLSYQLTTVTPITMDSAGNITAGSIKVVGANSSLLVTVTAANTFELQVDANGDGTYESTLSATAAELEAL